MRQLTHIYYFFSPIKLWSSYQNSYEFWFIFFFNYLTQKIDFPNLFSFLQFTHHGKKEAQLAITEFGSEFLHICSVNRRPNQNQKKNQRNSTIFKLQPSCTQHCRSLAVIRYNNFSLRVNTFVLRFFVLFVFFCFPRKNSTEFRFNENDYSKEK